jgi:hypothetical protein
MIQNEHQCEHIGIITIEEYPKFIPDNNVKSKCTLTTSLDTELQNKHAKLHIKENNASENEFQKDEELVRSETLLDANITSNTLNENKKVTSSNANASILSSSKRTKAKPASKRNVVSFSLQDDKKTPIESQLVTKTKNDIIAPVVEQKAKNNTKEPAVSKPTESVRTESARTIKTFPAPAKAKSTAKVKSTAKAKSPAKETLPAKVIPAKVIPAKATLPSMPARTTLRSKAMPTRTTLPTKTTSLKTRNTATTAATPTKTTSLKTRNNSKSSTTKNTKSILVNVNFKIRNNNELKHINYQDLLKTTDNLIVFQNRNLIKIKTKYFPKGDLSHENLKNIINKLNRIFSDYTGKSHVGIAKTH